MTEVKNTILQRRMIAEGETVLCAVSGGADSMCLLHVLKRLAKTMGFSLCCAHVHHGIRQGAEEDLAFVRDYCKEQEIPFDAHRIDTGALFARDTHTSLEEAARNARYAALKEMAKKASALKIAVGHHADDQAETVLFHLLRGTGLKGLAGIAPVNGAIIRPLLYTAHEDICAYLKAQEIPFVTDETNDDTDFTRNAIRHLLMPLAKEKVNARADVHLAQAASEAEMLYAFYEEETKKAYARCLLEKTEGDISFDVRLLRKESYLLRTATLKRALSHLSSQKEITRRQIDAIERIVTSGNGRAQLDLAEGIVAKRKGTVLRLHKAGGGETLEIR